MTDDNTTKQGMTRRDLMRRGAVVGGTLVWAAPTVQSLAPRAFAQDGPGTPRAGDCDFLLKDKWEWKNGSFSRDCGAAPFCTGNGLPLEGWNAHDCCSLLSNITVVETDGDGDPLVVTATLRTDCDPAQATAAAKGATLCEPAQINGNTITFRNPSRFAISYIAVMVCCERPCNG